MTEWHKEWQKQPEYLNKTEIKISNYRADVVIDNIILEFQHSKIDKEYINNKTKTFEENSYKTLWIIECLESIKVENIDDELYYIEFIDKWKYENFSDLSYIFLDNKDFIYKIKPSRVKSNCIYTRERYTKEEFIKLNINFNDLLCYEETLYFNQRGAGCGKTYESIQIIDKDERFKNKELFIYLTKMHTAKEVILNEIKEQNERGVLDNLEFDNISDELNKQYKISYYNKLSSKKCNIIIGTIDSFMYSIGNKKNNDRDLFRGLVKSIRGGYLQISNNGSINYAKERIKLNQKSIIIIDEAQDLDPEYIDATAKILEFTGIDAYIIGDKLQSIWSENNIYTYIENNGININIIKSEGVNHVMRFHNIQFKNFVNKLIDFKKYNLIEITDICNKKCKYKHEDNKKPYTLFQMETIYNNDADEEKIDRVINKIMDYMNFEIDNYNYLPNNFMFIFPILSKNYLVSLLETKIQEFWIKKIKDKNYIKNVLMKNDYWKDKIDDNQFHKFIYFHKSDEGKSINLKESENATRILSIHASKGNGCEVVFLLGLTEYTLTKFSHKTNNIIYDSLLHVAITRQKKALYIGLINNNDEIWNRFNKNFPDDIIKDDNIKQIISKNKLIKSEYIIDYFLNDKFDKINETFIIPNNYIDIIPKNNDNKNIIDFGHHIIRYNILIYNILSNIYERETIYTEDKNKDQFRTILNIISNYNIKPYNYNKYSKKLFELYNLNKIHKDDEINEIPICVLDDNINSKYYNYQTIIQHIMKHIQIKIKDVLKKDKMPILCPLETIILFYMIEITNDTIYSSISINDIYNIMYCFDECSNKIDIKHKEKYNCLCYNKFKSGIENNTMYNDIQRSICNHYKYLEFIRGIYDNYKLILEEKYPLEEFKYNIYHKVKFFKISDDFKISKKFTIIANSNNYVIYFIIKPQFNKLNFNDIIFDAIIHNYLLQNIIKLEDNNNYNRFMNKKILTYIITLDSIKPLLLDLNINKNDIIIKNIIKEYLYKINIDKCREYFDLYHTYKKDKKDENTIQCFFRKSKDDNIVIPYFIRIYFSNLEDRIKKDRETIRILDNVNLFLEDIKDELNNKIDCYLDINNELVDNYDF